MSKPKLGIVIGSIRPNRFGGHAAQWIEEIARRRTDFDVELIDLKDYPMPITTSQTEPNAVCLGVRDTGPGLSAETLPRLFEPFYTTKPDGMGMGLSICRSIIE